MTERAEAIAAAGSAARAALASVHEAREIALPASRASIRSSALAVRAVQRHEFALAHQHIEDARAHLARALDATVAHGAIRHAGFVADAQKEFAEANLTLAFIEGGAVPTASELGVEAAAYLNGMAEAASELRRQILDVLRAGNPERAEELFAVMDRVYETLLTVDYPDAVTGGLRRTTDALRAVLERTRGDVTNAAVVSRFQSAVEQARRS